jgi:hypothetical protein
MPVKSAREAPHNVSCPAMYMLAPNMVAVLEYTSVLLSAAAPEM